MGHTVHQPSEVQVHHVAHDTLRRKRPEECFVPEVHRNGRWHYETQEQLQWNEVSKPSKSINIKNCIVITHYTYFWWNCTTGSLRISLMSSC